MLQAVLQERDNRWELRKRLAQKLLQGSVLSLTICLLLRHRTSDELRGCFEKIVEEVEGRFAANGIQVYRHCVRYGADGPLCLWSTGTDSITAKKHCIEIEDGLSYGRILDIDVMGADGMPVDRLSVGCPPRRCFLCDLPAAVCAAGKTHSRKEMEVWIGKEVKKLIG